MPAVGNGIGCSVVWGVGVDSITAVGTDVDLSFSPLSQANPTANNVEMSATNIVILVTIIVYFSSIP
jgi:hypothetical protein